MDVHLTSMAEVKSYGAMDVLQTSNGRPSDFHHGDRRPMELWKGDGHPLEVNFYVRFYQICKEIAKKNRMKNKMCLF